MPHVPLYVSDKFRGKSKCGLYGDVIMEIDWSVGQVMQTLKELELEKNTLIVFTSDNGPWLEYGNHAGSALPLREHKGTTFDGGQREPCVMCWPGVIPAGVVCDQLVSTIDLLPTFAAITGAELPGEIIDGYNILPVLSAEKEAESPRDVFYFMHNGDVQAVRKGNWKLHIAHKYRHVLKAGMNGERGETVQAEIGMALYNLADDVGEQNNLAMDYPEKVEELKKILQEFKTDLDNNSRTCLTIE
jgi:arylsulfatase A-like enzyme